MEPKAYEQLVAMSKIKTRNGYSSLHVACTTGSAWMVELLLHKGAEIDAKCKLNRTPLYLACDSRFAKFGNQTLILELLLRHGAALDQRDSNGDTPLHCAAIRGSVESIEILLAYGADFNLRNAKGQTPFEQTTSLTARRSVLLRHVVKLKTAGFIVSDANSKLVETFMEKPYTYSYMGYNLNDFRRECEAELAVMQKAKISEELAIFDLLVVADSNVTKIARSAEILKALKSIDLERQYPLYAHFIRSSLARCIYRRDQLYSVEMLIESELVNSNVTETVVRELVDSMDGILLESLTNPSNANIVEDIEHIVNYVRWRHGDAIDDFYLVHRRAGTNLV